VTGRSQSAPTARRLAAWPNLPCTGGFELENGKIKVWGDYFDLGTYVKTMS
jgi:limonene-1,2-epoxide hydrolase